MNDWVVWFYVEPFTLHLNSHELTPIVPHCPGSGPSPGTGHSQCDYTMNPIQFPGVVCSETSVSLRRVWLRSQKCGNQGVRERNNGLSTKSLNGACTGTGTKTEMRLRK